MNIELAKFCNDLIHDKENNVICHTCKLCDKPMVVLDTNVETFGPVDVTFVALNPGKDEVIQGIPLIGRSGQYHRKLMATLPMDTRWLITNTILCHTANQAELGDSILETARNCKFYTDTILSKFPSRYYITMGAVAMNMLGVGGTIMANSGKIFTTKDGKTIIPIPHPSAVIQYHGKMEEAYKKGFEVLASLLSQIKV